VTGSRGGYRIANLAPGSYEVSFFSGCGAPSAPAYAAQWFAPQGGNQPAWLTARPGLVTSGIGARLRRAATITGVARNAAGKPVAGICPLAFALSGQPSAEPVLFGPLGPSGSARNGVYRVTGLATGRYAVAYAPCGAQPYALNWYAGSASRAGARPVGVTDGTTTSGINQTVFGGQAVLGTIRSGLSGSPVRSACVVAVDSGGFAAGLRRTDKLGGYFFRRRASGTYTPDVFPCALRASTLANVVQRDVRVPRSQPLRGVNVTLPLSGSLTGTVRGGTPAAPAPGICVEATPKSGRGMAGLAVTGAGGGYRLTSLAPGAYQVSFTSLCLPGSGGFVAEELSGGVQVTSGETRGGVGVTLVADGGIAGTVQAFGSPAAGVGVIAYPVTGQQTPAVAETGADGTYQIAGLPPASYLAEFTSGCGGSRYVTQWYNGAATKGTATPVAVTAGAVTSSIDAH